MSAYIFFEVEVKSNFINLFDLNQFTRFFYFFLIRFIA